MKAHLQRFAVTLAAVLAALLLYDIGRALLPARFQTIERGGYVFRNDLRRHTYTFTDPRGITTPPQPGTVQP